MPIYPGAIYKPITAAKGRTRMSAYNRINLHTAVTSSSSLHTYFNQSGRPDSHFYVREDGTVEQYVDTSLRAFADLDGNDATISIETWDGYGRVPWPGGQPPPWTPAQLASLAALCAWIMRTHDIPVRLAQNSQPGASSRGLSWHRLGIDGAFPRLPDQRAGRLQRGGGMHYSKSAGKVCPGDARIAQVPSILAAISKPTPTPAPAPAPVVQEEPDMVIIRRKSDGAAFAVSGGRGARVVSGTDMGAAPDGVPTWNVSDSQYSEFANRYLAGA